MYDLEEGEAAERAGRGGKVGAERGDEALTVTGVQLRGERGWSESGGGRHAALQSGKPYPQLRTPLAWARCAAAYSSARRAAAMAATGEDAETRAARA